MTYHVPTSDSDSRSSTDIFIHKNREEYERKVYSSTGGYGYFQANGYFEVLDAIPLKKQSIIDSVELNTSRDVIAETFDSDLWVTRGWRGVSNKMPMSLSGASVSTGGGTGGTGGGGGGSTTPPANVNVQPTIADGTLMTGAEFAWVSTNTGVFTTNVSVTAINTPTVAGIGKLTSAPLNIADGVLIEYELLVNASLTYGTDFTITGTNVNGTQWTAATRGYAQVINEEVRLQIVALNTGINIFGNQIRFFNPANSNDSIVMNFSIQT